MKNLWQLITLILAITVCVMAIQNALSKMESSKTVQPENPSEVILENILTRKSVRMYQDKPVEKEKVDLLLRAGMAAPTAGNKQPWSFLVIDDRSLLVRLSEVLPYARFLDKSPMAIVVCGDLSKTFRGIEEEYWVQDASAASQNILLMAHGLGLGAVWTGVYPMPDRMKDVSEILHLPDSIIPLNVIPIGYPQGDTPVKDKWTLGNIRYNQWAE